ncbi:MAG: glucosamine/galactosamine-6-phosphate isomerase [Ferruginibacter sp.]|nr:glucosamine/galactosamine-6-phosphate isomerase [Ferruginibacter sp.]
MKVITTNNPIELGRLAGKAAAALIIKAITQNGQANIILATGASQFETLKQLTSEKDIDWSKVVMFHLDEYIGLPESSNASFRRYLKERFLEKVTPLKATYLVNGERDPIAECNRLNAAIENHPIDVALVGIGENGHLAFNDPPADFDTEEPYIVVSLEELCRKQQFGEGWFKSIEDVPRQAISMSIKQIFKSKNIICSVPEGRKAKAVKDCLELPVSNLFPAGILQVHPNCTYFLDESSASLLSVQKGLTGTKIFNEIKV